MVVLADNATRACRELRTSLESIDLAVAQFGALLHAMNALGNNLPPHQCEAVQSIVTLQSLLHTHHKEIFTHTQSAWHSTRTLLPTQGAEEVSSTHPLKDEPALNTNSASSIKGAHTVGPLDETIAQQNRGAVS